MSPSARSKPAGEWYVGGAVCALMIAAVAALARGAASEPGRASVSGPPVQQALASDVQGFSSHKPLLVTLIEISSAYHLPMGIEKVTPESADLPVTVTLDRGTLAGLLTRCVRALPGYRWTVQDGVVNVYGTREKEWRRNLLNFIVPNIEIRGGTLNDVNAALRMEVPGRLPVRFSSVPPGKVFGVAGDTPGVGSLEAEHIDFEARNQTVRTILNRMVALSGGRAIWVSRVPPRWLSSNPAAGLWLFLPPDPALILPNLSLSASKRPRVAPPLRSGGPRR